MGEDDTLIKRNRFWRWALVEWAKGSNCFGLGLRIISLSSSSLGLRAQG